VLTGAAAVATGGLALSGCGPLLTGQDEQTIPAAAPDALEPLLRTELALLAGYDAAIAAFPALTGWLRGVRADHAAHAQALRARLDPRRSKQIPPAAAPTPATVAATTPAALAALAAAERAAAGQATAACLAATGERAALLASIAASETSHLVVVA